jgi:hypothetical protein
MTIEIINKINAVMENLNSNQKKIAKSATINKNFQFFISYVNNQEDLFFKDRLTGEVYNFITFVKKSCNCD